MISKWWAGSTHPAVRGAFGVVGGIAGGFSSVDDPSRLSCAVDEGAGAHGSTVAAVNPLRPRLTPAATAHPCPVE